MKKKIVMMAIALALTAGSAFALPEFNMSVGGGGVFAGNFEAGILHGSIVGQSVAQDWSYLGGGAYAFFDATYAEVSFGVLAGGGQIKNTPEALLGPSSDYSVVDLTFGLLGKWPFAIGSKFAVFPLLGIDYHVRLSAKQKNPVSGDMEDMLTLNNGDKAAEDMNALWFKVGAGVDFAFTDHIYLRFEALYGFRLPNQYEDDGVSIARDTGVQNPRSLWTHGFTAKLAAGYKF